MIPETSEARGSRWQGWNGAGAVAAAILVWGYMLWLHQANDGLWYQGDSARHAANGAFWWDFLARAPLSAMDFALAYYARYPVINPTAYPPVFYVVEGAVYRLFGVSPYVAKSLVLAFVLLGGFYLVAWSHRWAGRVGAWIGVAFALQPGVVVWGQAIMLNVPSMVLGTAALYHWRRWLEDQRRAHLVLAMGWATLAILTYVPVVIVLAVMGVWAVHWKRVRTLLHWRTALVLALAAVPIALWAVIALKFAQGARTVGFLDGPFPFWRPSSWAYYPVQVFRLISPPVLLLAVVAVIAGWRRRGREVADALLWLGVCYLWFSLVSVKEPRYALLVIPPCLLLAGIGGAEIVERIARPGRTLAPAVAIGLVGLMLTMEVVSAARVPIFRVQGFREMAQVMRQLAPNEFVFYEGFYNGIFSLYLRADDPSFQRGVILGSKLLYAAKISPRFGLVEHVSSPEDVDRRLRQQCNCRYLLLEREFAPADESRTIPALRHLREALAGDHYAKIRTFDVETPRGHVRHVDLYEQRAMTVTAERRQLTFPALREGASFEVAPLDAAKGSGR